MHNPAPIPSAKDPLLFTPGPLTTSRPVKQAMLRDVGSWDAEFAEVVARVRRGLLSVAGLSPEHGYKGQCYDVVPMQGSGTFGLEAVIVSAIPEHGKLLVLANGAYGERIAKIVAMHKIASTVLRTGEDQPPTPEAVDAALAADPAITHVIIVHCETTSGILNPIEAIGQVVKRHNRLYIVDAMSTFGALPIDFEACGIHYLVSSANKCIEGVPGFCFVIFHRDTLLASDGAARSLSLDLLDQWRYMQRTGLFRYTPPTHVILAFDQALAELMDEGGRAAREARYRDNHARLVAGMRRIGFREYVPTELQSPIITTFLYPADANFTFAQFYERLKDRGHIIYSGKITKAECFRIGNIGRIGLHDIDALLAAIGQTLSEMGVVMQEECSSQQA